MISMSFFQQHTFGNGEFFRCFTVRGEAAGPNVPTFDFREVKRRVWGEDVEVKMMGWFCVFFFFEKIGGC